MDNKRGLSNVLSILLVVVIGIVAVGLIWGYVNKTLNESGETIREEIAVSQIDYEIIEKSVVVNEEGNLSFNVKRNSGGVENSGFIVAIQDSEGNIETFNDYENSEISQLEIVKVNIDKNEHDLLEIASVAVYATVDLQLSPPNSVSGLGGATDSFVLPEPAKVPRSLLLANGFDCGNKPALATTPQLIAFKIANFRSKMSRIDSDFREYNTIAMNDEIKKLKNNPNELVALCGESGFRLHCLMQACVDGNESVKNRVINEFRCMSIDDNDKWKLSKGGADGYARQCELGLPLMIE